MAKEIKGIITKENDKYIYTVEFTIKIGFQIQYVHDLTGLVVMRECTVFPTAEAASARASQSLPEVKAHCKHSKKIEQIHAEIVQIECSGPTLHHRYKK